MILRHYGGNIIIATRRLIIIIEFCRWRKRHYYYRDIVTQRHEMPLRRFHFHSCIIDIIIIPQSCFSLR